MEASRLNRVSPWEIEPSGSASTTNTLMAASLKRTKIGSPLTKLEFPVP
ncbi:auxin response factor 3-like, partial [Trifolium medium]|nr:auxin response factor 3-like [Trifolium medium]